MKSVEDSNGFFLYPWLFLREEIGKDSRENA